MTKKEASVQAYIDRVLSPKIQGDGGWVEFVSLREQKLTLCFRGECAKCLILNRCVDWIQQQLVADLHLNLQINAVRKKPYFQDR